MVHKKNKTLGDTYYGQPKDWITCSLELHQTVFFEALGDVRMVGRDVRRARFKRDNLVSAEIVSFKDWYSIGNVN